MSSITRSSGIVGYLVSVTRRSGRRRPKRSNHSQTDVTAIDSGHRDRQPRSGSGVAGTGRRLASRTDDPGDLDRWRKRVVRRAHGGQSRRRETRRKRVRTARARRERSRSVDERLSGSPMQLDNSIRGPPRCVSPRLAQSRTSSSSPRGDNAIELVANPGTTVIMTWSDPPKTLAQRADGRGTLTDYTSTRSSGNPQRLPRAA